MCPQGIGNGLRSDALHDAKAEREIFISPSSQKEVCLSDLKQTNYITQHHIKWKRRQRWDILPRVDSLMSAGSKAGPGAYSQTISCFLVACTGWFPNLAHVPWDLYLQRQLGICQLHGVEHWISDGNWFWKQQVVHLGSARFAYWAVRECCDKIKSLLWNSHDNCTPKR